MISVRYFRNYDAPAVAQLWSARRRELGGDPPVSQTAMEVIVLGRSYFSAKNLLIAESEGATVGYAHWVLSAENPRTSVIAGIATTSAANRDQIAQSLIDKVVEESKSAAAAEVLLGQAPEHWTGYAGLDRCGTGSGIAQNDSNTRRWAEQNRFVPARELVSHTLLLASYRPAFDRELLALRRTATVDRRRDVTDQPFRIASAMSHLEMHRFVAVERTGIVLAEAEMLLADPEMMIVSGGTVLLSGWRTPDVSATSQAAVRFVLSSAISELAAERTTKISATTEAKNTAETEILRAVGFQVEQHGTIFRRPLENYKPIRESRTASFSRKTAAQLDPPKILKTQPYLSNGRSFPPRRYGLRCRGFGSKRPAKPLSVK